MHELDEGDAGDQETPDPDAMNIDDLEQAEPLPKPTPPADDEEAEERFDIGTPMRCIPKPTPPVDDEEAEERGVRTSILEHR
jgi:hypothetical protein